MDEQQQQQQDDDVETASREQTKLLKTTFFAVALANPSTHQHHSHKFNRTQSTGAA